MDCNSKEFITAVEAFFEGKSTDNQERMLKVILSRADDDGMTDELRSLKTLLSGNGRISEEQFDTRALTAAVAEADGQRTGLFWSGTLAGAVVAAAIAVAVIFGVNKDPQSIYGYDINGQAILDVDSALEVMGSMNLLTALEESMDDAMNLISNLSVE